MIWINLIKNYLVAISSKDTDFLNANLDDSIIFSYEGREYKYKSEVISFIINYLSQIDNISIRILNTAYNNKLFFVEYEMKYNYIEFSKYTNIKKYINIIEIGNSSKITSIKTYTYKE